ncbi:MAG: ABC transporter permease [Anaeroplasmataceae bacterium]|nr:ABC transporter permease [Anaeroplasmataceae bacterium]
MMSQEVKFPKATLEEYGYKDYKVLNMVWKIAKIVLVIFSIFMLYLSIIVIAIQSFNSSASTTEFQGFTFNNYLQMFSKRSLTNSIKNTFLVSITATLIAAVLGTFVAIGIYYLPPKIKSRLMLLNNIPLLNADIVTGISLMLIFSLLLPINRHIFGFWTILIAHLFFIFPYIILSVLPKMKEIDPNLMDASMDLGIKPLKSVIRVLIPAIRGGIFSGVVLAFTISFEDFVVGYFTTGNGFNTLSIWIYSSIGKKSLFPGVYAFSTALTVISMILIILYAIWTKGRRNHAKKN